MNSETRRGNPRDESADAGLSRHSASKNEPYYGLTPFTPFTFYEGSDGNVPPSARQPFLLAVNQCEVFSVDEFMAFRRQCISRQVRHDGEVQAACRRLNKRTNQNPENNMSQNSDPNQAEQDNRADQMNPNNDAYWQSRGEDSRPDNWQERDDED